MKEGTGRTLSSFGLTILGTTCCALPLTLVLLGAGVAVASMASAAPWLMWLSGHKAWTCAFTAVALTYAHWQARRVGACDIADAKRLRWQTWVLRGSTGLFALSPFAAYALLPLKIWFDGRG